MSTSTIHVRVDDETKAKAIQALEAMGLDLSTAVRVYLARISAEQRLPFELRVPNMTTQQAIQELENGQGHKVGSVDSLFEELNAGD